jgi:hypothetical protein
MNIHFILENSKGSKKDVKKIAGRPLAPLEMREAGQKAFVLIS